MTLLGQPPRLFVRQDSHRQAAEPHSERRTQAGRDCPVKELLLSVARSSAVGRQAGLQKWSPEDKDFASFRVVRDALAMPDGGRSSAKNLGALKNLDPQPFEFALGSLFAQP